MAAFLAAAADQRAANRGADDGRHDARDHALDFAVEADDAPRAVADSADDAAADHYAPEVAVAQNETAPDEYLDAVVVHKSRALSRIAVAADQGAADGHAADLALETQNGARLEAGAPVHITANDDSDDIALSRNRSIAQAGPPNE